MATLTIRDLDDLLKHKLRMRAAGRNHSMEEEARQILRAALTDASMPAADIVSRIRSRFSGLGDIELLVPEREVGRPPPDFNGEHKPAARRSKTFAAGKPGTRRRE